MFPASFLEILAVCCVVVNIYLAARAHILNWIFGIVAVSLYAIIFFKTKLYADMSLQVVFLILQFYGWQQWLFGSDTQSALAVRKISAKMFFLGTLVTSILFIGIHFILAAYTDSTTVYLDAFITAVSLMAQWMMSKKWVENWWLWMIVDVVSMRLYLLKQLYFTSGLYAVLLLICIYGYLHWQKELNQQPVFALT